MISENRIKFFLKQYIRRGAKSFIIYPFGVNGVKVRNILKDYYGLTPIFIVDNEYAQYNSHIISLEMLKERYDGNAYIILTVENKEINESMMRELQNFVSLSYIINLKKLECGLADLSNFRMEKFLPNVAGSGSENCQKYSALKKDSKIKVRVISRTSSTWNSIETMCLAFQSDERFDLLIISGKNMDEKATYRLNKYGLSYISPELYCAEEDIPDILIVNHPYDTITQIEGFRRNCKLVIAASMQLIRYEYDMKAFWNLQEKGFGRFHPDYYLYDSLLYNEIMHSEYASEKIVEMGNAKFDGIYKACKKKHYRKSWQKLKGKKVILWTTDHGVNKDSISKDVTFDLYAKAIFKYAEENKNVGIIFRPHSTFVKEMLEYELWSEKDLELLKKYCRESENLIFDASISYDNAYSLADGIIADAFCGISCSALPTLKPICLAYRCKADLPYHQELANCYESAYSCEEIITFMNDIRDGKDTTLELRKEACRKYVKHFDGKNGLRIKEFITEKYYEKIDQIRRNS